MLDFLGIGAQKAGTTWLYERLRTHPRIAFPAGKEVHFWDARRAEGLEWYRGLFGGGTPGTVQGEITPAYAILPGTAVREIHAFNPALRLIFLIRNPIERAWSAALMALGRAEMRIEEASDAWFLDHFRSQGSLARGDYEACLRTWRTFFPAGQMLIGRYERILRDPAGLLGECCRHLGVAAEIFEGMEAGALGEKVFAGPGHAIRPSLLPALREIHRPRIRSLETYLDADLGEWMDT